MQPSRRGKIPLVQMNLVERKPGLGERYWTPFDSADGFNQDWWCRMGHVTERYRYFSVIAEDHTGPVEVARVQMDETPPRLIDYRPIPGVQGFLKEVQLIEVHPDYRGQELGGDVVDVVSEAFPSHRLVALSKADRFWESLKWSRHTHHEDNDGYARHWPLYVQR